MLEAAIFDMDGLLVDSEPLWRRAEQTVFPLVGIHLTEAMCARTMGTRVDEVVRYWYTQKPWDNCSLEEVTERITAEVVRLVEQEGRPMAGVDYILDFFAQRGIAIALASSSATRLIDSVVARLGIRGRFAVLQSAELEPYGKPHPGVFLSAAAALGVEPTACLVFEDSFAGLIAGKAARMKVVAVPAAESFADRRFDIADLKLESLREFDTAALRVLEADGR
jgi:mannitol-1-/sugar-/sorbitol-6-/2-deoxyglucose-6-phosphatase